MATQILTITELKARMSETESRLRSSASGASFGAGLTLIVGLALLGGLGYYFYWGYNQIVGFMTPTNIVDAAETQLIDKAKEARVHVEGLIKQNAPSWAEMASKAIQDNIPTARKHAVEHSMAAFDDVMKRSTDEAKPIIEKFIAGNKSMIQEGIKKLAKDDKSAEAFVTEIGQVFAKEAEVDINQLVGRVGDFVDGFNNVLSKTKSDSVRMSNLQAMQREILMLAKRALIQHTPPATP